MFEPAQPGGEYVIQRKGVGKYIMKISGRAAHAGAQPEQGRSAVGALDGMGPRGTGAHSDRESMEVATLTQRSHVTALFLAKWPELIATI